MGYCDVCLSAGSVNSYGFCGICGAEHMSSGEKLLAELAATLDGESFISISHAVKGG